MEVMTGVADELGRPMLEVMVGVEQVVVGRGGGGH
jgi:hypothetical protein